MDESTRETIASFLAQYETLAIATVHDGQPYVTRVFFVEDTVSDSSLKLYGTFITSSRKLANLRENARVGLFIGPSTPSVWLEATAEAHILTDDSTVAAVRENLGKKSAVAAGFIAQVPTAAVELRVNWLRITNLTGGPVQTEVSFDTQSSAGE
ncbi:MAG TPA: pyridoxamine 5'-phosphate oxidase family protein [Ktedonobacteraceae bacterium]|nr:pyridoxamine 5'-phosphate oxidase family protein [Ktedonobacteraceae bacterium]